MRLVGALDRQDLLPAHLAVPPEALCGGISKVNFQETLSSFGDKCPQNGSKTAPTAPRPHLGYPHIGPFVECQAPRLIAFLGSGFRVSGFYLRVTALSDKACGSGVRVSTF